MNPILLDIPTEFQTERLLVRAYRPGDGAMYYQALRVNWEHLYEFMPEQYLRMQSEADAELIIRKLGAEWALRNLFIFGVWEKDSGRYLGETYLANADWHVPCIEVGYFLLQASTGKGFATEAARGALRFAFEHLGVLRVELQCAADNLASQRVAERCGFRLEGRFRQRQRKKSGALVDRLWYGLLKEEYRNDYSTRQ
jgi:ribosomal-protein-serine acetyltransferase